MELQEHLRLLGLKTNEVRVYLYVLEHGVATPSLISKHTRIQRPNTYHILESLVEKGLLIEQSQGKRKAYLTSDPESLLIGLERKKEIVETILPNLRGLRNIQRNKPTIRFFDGLSQIQEIYNLALQSKELLALGSTDRLYQIMPAFVETWLKQLKQRGIVLKDIVTHVSGNEAVHKMIASLRGYYDARVLPESFGELDTDLLLWDDNLALITLSEPYFGTVITNPSLAKTFRSILELLRQKIGD